MKRLYAEEVTVIYNRGEPTEVVAVEQCSFDLNEAEPLVIYGANGSGKTSLLRVLAGLQKPTTGRIVFIENHDESSVSAQWLINNSEYVRQRPTDGLFPELSLSENVALRISPKQRTIFDPYLKSKRFRQAETEIESLTPFYMRYRHRRLMELSGGEQQIFALALAQYVGRRLILLDEPTAALDPEFTTQIEHRLLAWLTLPGMLSIIVTHDRDFRQRLNFRTLDLSAAKSSHAIGPENGRHL